MKKINFWRDGRSQLKLLALSCVITSLSVVPAVANDNGELSSAPMVLAQQPGTVSGVVTDMNGAPLIGAAVVVKGTTTGTTTNVDGSFNIRVAANQTLEVSYFGYDPQDVPVGSKTSFEIALSEQTLSVEEVVVVGYGVQKKANLSGAVTAVDVGKMTESRPVTNISSALSGTTPGVFISTSNNSPTNNGSANITIRGAGTLNNNSPLVIVDGVESSLGNVNPQDVATMTVLKDASSSAIYGSRAANGVILVTTKSGGSDGFKVEYNGYLSLESANEGNMQYISDYSDYMTYVNEGFTNSGSKAPYSQDMIDLWAANRDGDEMLYPNTNLWDLFGTSAGHQHNISVSGGSKNIKFYNSVNYLDNPGVIENTGYSRVSMRSNIDANVNKWLKIGTQINGNVSKSDAGSNQLTMMFKYLMGTNPGMVYRHDDGRFGGMNNSEDLAQAGVNNPLGRLNSIRSDDGGNQMKARFFVEVSPLESLKINGSHTYEYINNYTRNRVILGVDKWNFLNETIQTPADSETTVSGSDNKVFRNFSDATIHFERSFVDDRLHFSILGGASQELYRTDGLSASRKDLLDPSLGVMNAATGDATGSSSRSEWAMNSYFGRLNLNWDEKYLFEANFRADGSSRFAAGNRWGYFPSFSGAWRVTEEDSMKDILWLDNLKLRASYGSLGNNSIGNYESQSVYKNSNYVLNNAISMGMATLALSNAAVSWETTTMTNIAADFGVLSNRLSGSVEYFIKKTDGILIDLPAPLAHGTSGIPKTNAAVVSNHGVEVSLTWNDRIGDDFSYSVGLNGTYIKNNVDSYKGEGIATFNTPGTMKIEEGCPINIYYLREVDRIIESEADLAMVQDIIDNAPEGVTAFPAGKPGMGDILYKDLNGDGQYGGSADRKEFGNGSSPDFTYGASLSMSYKNFDFSTLLQGVAGYYGYMNSTAFRSQVALGYQLNEDIIDGRWYEGRETPAQFPRLTITSDTRNSQPSNMWLFERDFLKIRNIQIGYTLPSHILEKLDMSKVRVYCSLENFFTFTDWKGLDPEFNAVAYPSMKQAVLGINIGF